MTLHRETNQKSDPIFWNFLQTKSKVVKKRVRALSVRMARSGATYYRHSSLLEQRKACQCSESPKNVRMQKLHQWKACNTFPVLERKGDRRRSVESRILYVWIRESLPMFCILKSKDTKVKKKLSMRNEAPSLKERVDQPQAGG